MQAAKREDVIPLFTEPVERDIVTVLEYRGMVASIPESLLVTNILMRPSIR